MKRFYLVITVIPLLLCFACTRSERTFKDEYKMQVTVGPMTYWGMGASRFAELVSSNTAGRVNVKPYFGSQLLKGAQLNSAQMVAMGSIDAALDSTINMAPVIPEMNIFSLPFFVETYARLDRMEQGKTGTNLFQRIRDKKLEPLAWGENGFRLLTNGRRPVTTPTDLHGLKIRVVGSPIFIDIFRALGADPVNMNWGDAVTSFQQETVDGQENPMQILLAVRIGQYHKYVTNWRYVIDPLIFYWNKEEFDRFPPDIQEAIRNAARDAARYQKALARAGLDSESATILKTEFGLTGEIANPWNELKNDEVTVTTPSPQQMSAFKEATRDVFSKWASRIGTNVVDTAIADMETK